MSTILENITHIKTSIEDVYNANSKHHTVDGKITDNYREYLEDNLHIGFMEQFPVKTILESYEITNKVRGFDVTYKVHYVELSFGNGEYTVKGIVTDIVDVAKRMGNSFGSHCYIDEGKAMEISIVKLCLKKDLMICQKVCSWPFAKVVVQQNFYKN